MKKLTLSADEGVIREAKRLARRNRTPRDVLTEALMEKYGLKK